MPAARIRYTNSVADLLAFQEHHITHDETAQRMILRSRLLGAIAVAVLIGAYVGLASKSYVMAVPLALAAAVAFAIVFPRLIRGRMQRQIRARHAQGRDKKFTCEHTLTIEGQSFRVKTPFEDTVVPIGPEVRVERTPTHGFIRIGEVGGYIVPLNTSEGDAREFLDQIEAANEKPLP